MYTSNYGMYLRKTVIFSYYKGYFKHKLNLLREINYIYFVGKFRIILYFFSLLNLEVLHAASISRGSNYEDY